ncbi:hypothetical protein EZV73_22350 [Acidaminobacter sp. JC074]|uniref:hypothetical protein n=1 Tax=Acidaminobacter sp. JC074 TaxID=2530199 RepID=UPI001F10DB20|nr:hypothetical protein [Acidaminobacter sp. JC074]MCH4890341.1 hypothetical protein [Acidaminobacter sp. JC074]
MKFIIHPLVYFLMLVIEIIGIYLLNMHLTKVKANKKSLLIGTTCYVIIIFLMDVFLFNYHKSLSRSLIIFVMMFFYFFFINKTSLLNTFKQLVIVIVSILVLDVLVQLIAGGLKLEWDWLAAYFSYMYAIYLAFLYMTNALLSITHISVLDLSQT